MKSFCVLAVLILFLSVLHTTVYADMCICPRIMDPVCGSDLQSYNNKCLLDCEAKSVKGRSIQLRVLKKGRCDEHDYFE